MRPRHLPVLGCLAALMVCVTAGCGEDAARGRPAASPDRGQTLAEPPGRAAIAPIGTSGPDALVVTARDFAFSPGIITARAGQPIRIHLKNEDAGAPHGLSFAIGGAGNQTCTGPCSTDQALPPQEPGEYAYQCTVHLNMKGTLRVE